MQIAKKYVKEHPFPPIKVAEAEREIILPIVTRMETELKTPDDMVIEKLDEDKEKKALYLIAKGECVVDFRHGSLHTQTSSQLLR